MERLTVNDLNKVCYDPWELCGMDSYCTKKCHEEGGCTKGCHILKMYHKLAYYEDLEEECIRENTWSLKILLKKWKEFFEDMQELYEYRKLKKQGKLLKLPCAVGDIVYQNMIIGVDGVEKKFKYKVSKAKVFKFSLDSYTLSFWTETVDKEKHQNEVPLSAFGKTVFFTREEAEQALKALKEKKNY